MIEKVGNIRHLDWPVKDSYSSYEKTLPRGFYSSTALFQGVEPLPAYLHPRHFETPVMSEFSDQ